MKKKILFLITIAISCCIWAQAPEKMSFQALVRDAGNNLIVNTAVGMQFSILQGSAEGSAVYVETQTPNSTAQGLVNLEIGMGSVVTGIFASIDWSAGPYFLKTETDPGGGTNYTITGTTELLSVPYALHAKTAESITGTPIETDPVFGASDASAITITDITTWNNKSDFDGQYNSLTGAPALSSGTSIGEMLYWDGGSWVAISPGTDGQTLVNCAGKPQWTNGNCIYELGDYTEGGIVGYILQLGDAGYDPDVQHGIVVAMDDQSTGIAYCNGSIVASGATATAIGSGSTNTATIVSVYGDGNYAAKICYDLSANGFSDWFLPCVDELNAICQNTSTINTSLIANGGAAFASAEYFNSTDCCGNSNQVINMGSCGSIGRNKCSYMGHVRAIRYY